MKRVTLWLGLTVAMLGVVAVGQARADVTLHVAPTQTYYDNSDGTLATAFTLPSGLTLLQFSVTGDVVTAGGGPKLSPDGLDSSGNAEFNFTNTFFGSAPTYNGVSIGKTSGTDPALFGIFFSPSFVGTAPNSANYRSDASPDLRILTTYSPSLNQPFFIGNGFTGNNGFGQPVTGTQQTFNIPVGATELLLGLGADPVLSDNSDPGFTVTITNASAVPEPSTLVWAGPAALLALGHAWRRRKRVIV
jgi:hypothetical protein